jgi:alpha-D-xyloside xylohydrolase
MLRAMVLEFPDDLTCRPLDLQYMLGSALLVAPVFSADGKVAYYLPEGGWRNLLTGEVASAPGWRKEQHGYLSLPLWRRCVGMPTAF